MAVEEEVKLIGGWESAYVARVRTALNLKGIPYEFLEEAFGKKSDLLLKSNPVHKKIPVLLHAGKPICESLIIIEYIDEMWHASGPPILPSDPYERATARLWAAYIDEKLSPTIGLFLRESNEESKKGAKDQIFVALLQLEEAFVESSKGKSFFGGDNIGFVDIVLGSCIAWLKAMDKFAGIKFLDEEKIPRLVEWAECFCSASVSRDVVPQTEVVVELSKAILAFRRVVVVAPSSPNDDVHFMLLLSSHVIDEMLIVVFSFTII
ncbi:Glutathione S-transferase U17 [Platanthera guangdongensis]|uniref:glutathione transferase n=1 Tax=Platanthera guangdongensis TaxID=2320717 RepID=A0ABR2LNB4_9ASPA